MSHPDSSRALTAEPHAAAFELRCLETVLNSLDTLVYVADMQSYDLLFVSQHGVKVWGRPEGKKCYEYLQMGQTSPCGFCTNQKLLDVEGKPSGVLVWEFQNTVTQRWYQCRDQAIQWVDGRLVRLEIAIDITERKRFEMELAQAKLEAEAARQQTEELARVDALTRTYNRRAFFEHMQRLYAQIQREPQPMCLVMLDIDHFKRINDSHGHAFGDEVLVALCRRIMASMRDTDQLFRLGGEEFMIALMACDKASAFELIERLRNEISDMRLYAGDVPVQISCSFGIAEYRDGLGVDMLLAQADAAMYAAKQGGRNRTCIHSSVS